MGGNVVVYTVMVCNPTWVDHASFTTYAEARREAEDVARFRGLGSAAWRIERRVLANVTVLPTP